MPILYAGKQEVKVAQDEIKMSQVKGSPIFKYDFFNYLCKKYKEFYCLLCFWSGCNRKSHNCSNAQKLKEQHNFIVFTRKGYQIDSKQLNLKCKIIQKSSTQISSSSLKKQQQIRPQAPNKSIIFQSHIQIVQQQNCCANSNYESKCYLFLIQRTIIKNNLDYLTIFLVFVFDFCLTQNINRFISHFHFAYFYFSLYSYCFKVCISSNTIPSSLFHTFLSFFSTSSCLVNQRLVFFKELAYQVIYFNSFLRAFVLFSSINLLLRALSNQSPGLGQFFSAFLGLITLKDFFFEVIYLFAFYFRQSVQFIYYQNYNALTRQSCKQILQIMITYLKNIKFSSSKRKKICCLFVLFSQAYPNKAKFIEIVCMLMNSSLSLDTRFFKGRSSYSLQDQSIKLRYQLYQVQSKKEWTITEIESKKLMNNKQELFLGKLKQVIQTKEQNVERIYKDQKQIEHKIDFYQQYLTHLNKKILSLKQSVDDQVSKHILLNKHIQFVSFEDSTINTLSLSQILGVKCKFEPQILHNSMLISIIKNQYELQISKTTNDPFYCFVYNQHPMLSKGNYHFILTVQSENFNQFLIGVANCKNNSQTGSKSIYFNAQKMQIQSNGKPIYKVSGEFKKQSKLTFLINSEKGYFLIILDQMFLCQANLSQFKNQYLYLFIAVSSSHTKLKFDHHHE